MYANSKFPPAYLMDTEYQSFGMQALQLADALKKHNVDYKLHIFVKHEKLGHAFNIICKYPQSGIVLDEIFEFFNAKIAEAQTERTPQ